MGFGNLGFRDLGHRNLGLRNSGFRNLGFWGFGFRQLGVKGSGFRLKRSGRWAGSEAARLSQILQRLSAFKVYDVEKSWGLGFR